MEKLIKIKSNDTEDLQEVFFGDSFPRAGESIEIDSDMKLIYMSGFDKNILDNEIISFVLTGATSVSFSIIANFLYDKLKRSKDSTLIINNNEIKIEIQIIEKELKKNLHPKEDE